MPHSLEAIRRGKLFLGLAFPLGASAGAFLLASLCSLDELMLLVFFAVDIYKINLILAV
jgi:hypothetical protein